MVNNSDLLIHCKEYGKCSFVGIIQPFLSTLPYVKRKNRMAIKVL